MGRKFIDKRRAATFQLLARDTAEPGQSNGPDSDHVFVRVDNNPVMIGGFDEGNNDDDDDLNGDSDSRFADAPEDEDSGVPKMPAWLLAEQSGPLADHVRREILELGFPDDGYNYLTHMREIKNRGGGSMYYENPKPNLDHIPLDVKAYDASKVRVEDRKVEVNEKKVLYKVAEKSVKVRVQKAVDPEVIALLDENDSQFGSDVEDLEEDFVAQANLLEGGGGGGGGEEEEEEDEEEDEEESVGGDYIYAGESSKPMVDEFSSLHMRENIDQTRVLADEVKDDRISEIPRARRLLDEQFDLLEQQEYGTDNDDNFADEEQEPLERKLGNVIMNHKIDELDLDDKYKTPADFLRGDNTQHPKLSDSVADVQRRIVEYAEKYEHRDEDESVVILEESSDESEAWDCDTIVSTYSNLDNHPGKIGAPEGRKKKLAETVFEALKKRNNDNIITLRGKDRLPVDYLPQGKSASKEKVKVAVKTEQPKKRQEESKEEKKERKAAVKEDKREARRVKKETKELYRDEAKRAQRVASTSGPSSYRLN